jgi:lipopolysaccharide exporter
MSPPRITKLSRHRFAPELGSMTRLVLSEGAARGLSFLYYIVAARVLAPEGFGVVRYTITLALLVMGAEMALTTVVQRELGAARADPLHTRKVMGSALAVAAGVFLAFSVLSAAAAAGGLTGSADLPGLLVVFGGFAAFQLYYTIARGRGDFTRAAIVYAGGTLTQLVLLVMVIALTRPTPTAALVVFGLSGLLPIVVYEAKRPLVRGGGLSLDRQVLRSFWRVGSPLLIAQIGYAVWSSADSIWVERALGTEEIGLYGASKNLAQVFFVVTVGVNGVLLPRVAELVASGEKGEARLLTYAAAAGVMGIIGALAAVAIPLRSALVTTVYGDGYAGAAPALIGLAVGAVLYGGFQTFSMGAVGFGRPGVYTVGIGVAAVAEVLLLALVGGESSSAAAWAVAISTGAGLAVVVVRLVFRPLSRRGETPAEATDEAAPEAASGLPPP